MESYHTGHKFCGGARNEAQVPKFLPPSPPPRSFLSLEKNSPPASPALIDGKQLAAVCRINALRRLRCCALAVGGFWEGDRPGHFRETTNLYGYPSSLDYTRRARYKVLALNLALRRPPTERVYRRDVLGGVDAFIS